MNKQILRIPKGATHISIESNGDEFITTTFTSSTGKPNTGEYYYTPEFIKGRLTPMRTYWDNDLKDNVNYNNKYVFKDKESCQIAIDKINQFQSLAVGTMLKMQGVSDIICFDNSKSHSCPFSRLIKSEPKVGDFFSWNYESKVNTWFGVIRSISDNNVFHVEAIQRTAFESNIIMDGAIHIKDQSIFKIISFDDFQAELNSCGFWYDPIKDIIQKRLMGEMDTYIENFIKSHSRASVKDIARNKSCRLKAELLVKRESLINLRNDMVQIIKRNPICPSNYSIQRSVDYLNIEISEMSKHIKNL